MREGILHRLQRWQSFWPVQSKLVGNKAAASRARGERGSNHGGRARPQSVSVGKRGGRTRQASLELHWDCYKSLRLRRGWRCWGCKGSPGDRVVPGASPTRRRLVGSTMASIQSRSLPRSRRMPRPVAWPRQVTLEAPAPPRPQRDERMKHPNRSLSQPNKRSRGKPQLSRKPSCFSPAQWPRRIPTPGHVDPASVSAVVTHREHICKP